VRGRSQFDFREGSGIDSEEVSKENRVDSNDVTLLSDGRDLWFKDICRAGLQLAALNANPYQVLIADDDAQFREVLRSLLEPFFCLLEAASGEQAIKIVEGEHVDLILLDMHMDRLTGIETIQMVKLIEPATPCILITADATEELVREAIDVDAFSVLKKPVRKADLLQTVDSAMVATYQTSPLSLNGPNAI
jgi:CheY-like chemotaxis protein